jgi:CO/xanthine dehydrogenase Mo-binding subunit
LTGRGIAYAQRSDAVVAIAEVEIDRRSGKVWAREFTVAHDCGLIINPDGLRRCIEGNVVCAAPHSPRSGLSRRWRRLGAPLRCRASGEGG